MPDLKKAPAVFIPVYNEGWNIEDLLSDLAPLQRQGIIGQILLVDDHSTDNSSKIASKTANLLGMDVSIMRLHENHGKAMAFYQALKYFNALPREGEEKSGWQAIKAMLGKGRAKVQYRPQIMIMLDGDIRVDGQKQIHELMKGLGEANAKSAGMPSNGKGEKAVAMTIGSAVGVDVHGREMEATIALSGQRAFILDALTPILSNENRKRSLLMPQGRRGGYGLEQFLNDYFGTHRYVFAKETNFRTGGFTDDFGRPGRSAEDSKRPRVEIDTMDKELRERKFQANYLQAIRKASRGKAPTYGETRAFPTGVVFDFYKNPPDARIGNIVQGEAKAREKYANLRTQLLEQKRAHLESLPKVETNVKFRWVRRK